MLGRGWQIAGTEANKVKEVFVRNLLEVFVFQRRAIELIGGKIPKPSEQELTLTMNRRQKKVSSVLGKRSRNETDISCLFFVHTTKFCMKKNFCRVVERTAPSAKRRRVNKFVAALGNTTIDSDKENRIRGSESAHDDIRQMEKRTAVFEEVDTLNELEKCEEKLADVTMIIVDIYRCLDRNCSLVCVSFVEFVGFDVFLLIVEK